MMCDDEYDLIFPKDCDEKRLSHELEQAGFALAFSEHRSVFGDDDDSLNRPRVHVVVARNEAVFLAFWKPRLAGDEVVTLVVVRGTERGRHPTLDELTAVRRIVMEHRR